MIYRFTPTGPHRVGFDDGEVLDGARHLPLRLWYPTTADGDDAWHGDEEVFRSYGRDGLVPAEWTARLAGAASASTRGPDPLTGPLPVLLFSHGAAGFMDQSRTLMEELASHGYLVVVLGHTGGACAVRHLDGTVTRISDEFTADLETVFPAMFPAYFGDLAARFAFARSDWGAAERQLVRWADDFTAVRDALHDGTVAGPAAAIVRCADLSRVAMGGFSFSGPAAALAAHRDARVQAAVNLDGGDWCPALVDTEVRCPVLAVASDQPKYLSLLLGAPVQLIDFHELSYERLSTIGTRPDVHRYVVDGPTHHELTDTVLLPREARTALPGAGQVDADDVLPTVHGIVRAFLDHYLLGTGQSPDDVQLARLRRVDLGAVREWAATTTADATQ